MADAVERRRGHRPVHFKQLQRAFGTQGGAGAVGEGEASMKATPSARAMVIRLAARRHEIENIERLAGPSGLRSLPWHAIFAAQLREGTASPEIVKAAEVSRREWEQVPEAAQQERRALAKKAAARRGG